MRTALLGALLSIAVLWIWYALPTNGQEVVEPEPGIVPTAGATPQDEGSYDMDGDGEFDDGEAWYVPEHGQFLFEWNDTLLAWDWYAHRYYAVIPMGENFLHVSLRFSTGPPPYWWTVEELRAGPLESDPLLDQTRNRGPWKKKPPG